MLTDHSLLDAALDGLSALVAVVDSRGHVVHANAAWLDHPSHPWAGAPAAIGSDLAALFAARRENSTDADELARAIEGTQRGDAVHVVREYALGDARSPSHWRTTLRSLPQGAMLVQHEDVTGPRTTEAALKRSQARMRTILTGAPLVLFSLDARGTFTLVEGMSAGAGGFAGPEQIGTSVFTAYAHMPALLDVVRGALAGRIGVTLVQIGRLAFEIRCSPLLGQDDAIDGVVGIATDVSERVRLQALKDEFISIVSHELRTPLTSIRGSLGLLEGGVTGTLPDRAGELVRIARINTDRLIRLINDMLDLDKMEAGLLELAPAEMSLSDIVDTAVHEMSGLATHVGVTLLRTPDDLGRCLVTVDRDRIVQVLVNLLSNAIKFSPAGGEVHIALRLRTTHVRVTVLDSGPGIASQDLGRLFHKFSQIDASDSRARGGSGLGLVICKRIVEASGGRIGVRTEPGLGSEFWIDLPLPTTAVAAPDTATPDRRATVEFSPLALGEPQPLGRMRLDELLASLQDAAEGIPDALADAHAAAMFVASALPVGSREQLALHEWGRAIDAAIAAPTATRRDRATQILAEAAPMLLRLRGAATLSP
jgi:signal transduction histidine kinase